MRSALTSPRAAGQLRAIFTAALGGPEPGTRAALAGAHLLGIAIARYIVRIEPWPA